MGSVGNIHDFFFAVPLVICKYIYPLLILFNLINLLIINFNIFLFDKGDEILRESSDSLNLEKCLSKKN